MKHLYVAVFAVLGLLPIAAWSQGILLPFNFNYDPATGAPTVGNETSVPYFAGSSIYPTYLTRGSGVTVGDTLARGFAGSGWNDQSLNAAVQGNRFYQFDLAQDYNGRLSIQALDYYLYRSATGPVWYQWEYSLDNFSTPGIPIGDSINFTGFDLNGIKQPEIITRTIPNLQYLIGDAAFRLYAWGASDTAGVFAFGRPAADNSIAVLGRAVQRFQDYSLGPSYRGSGFFTSAGKPSAPQVMYLTFGDISDTITITMPAGFEFSADSVHWTSVFKFDPFSPAYTTGQSVYVRLSAQAPAGTVSGNITLTTPALADAAPVPLYGTVYPADYTLLYASNFNTCDGYTPGPVTDGFTQYNVSGTQPWACSLYGRDPADLRGSIPAHGIGAQVNAGTSGNPVNNEAWLISPKLDLAETKHPLLNFWSRSITPSLGTGGPLQLKISTDYTGTGSPALAHWTSLHGHFPGVGSNIWTLSSNIDLSDYKKNGVYIAFVYTTISADASTWTIDDLSVVDASDAQHMLTLSSQRQDATGRLSWTTTEDLNSASFDIQRSGDNTSFTSIGAVKAKGNSATATYYNFIDQSPLTGNNYYRLKQVDPDGKFVYSKTVLLNFNSLTLRISPNPASGTVNLFVGNTTEAFSVQVLDLNGRIVRQLLTTPGTANIPVDISGLSRGIYTLKVIGVTATVTQKLLVQ